MTKHILSVSADAKTIKGEKKGVLTGVMYFAPHTLSGFQVCPQSTPECRAACLYTAGRGRFNKTQQARIDKTKRFFYERDAFIADLVSDIKRLVKKAKRNKMVAAVRLNGTSDIAWEKIACKDGDKVYRNVMEMFPDVQFYDYTKIIGRKYALTIPNYHLTYSLAENNDKLALQALTEGYNVAVVIKIKKTAAKPSTWDGYPAVDGDESDVRFYDPKGGHIVLLRAKGEAAKMQAGIGFVRAVDGHFNRPVVEVKDAA